MEDIPIGLLVASIGFALGIIFKNQPDFSLEPMVQNPQDYAHSIAQCHQTYLKFIQGDVILLGMGGDGHFASLFPNDEPSTEGLLATECGCLGTNAPSHPTKRISTNLAFIESIEHRILLITGKDKLEENGIKNRQLNTD